MRFHGLLASLLLFPHLLYGDASREDWIGSYSINHDGHAGTLRVFSSAAPCRNLPCPGLGVEYTDDHGASYPGTVGVLEENGQHLSFTIDFPGNTQRFDVYIFSFDKTKMAGTTVWGGRVFGVMAQKNNPQAAEVAAAERIRAANLLAERSSGPSRGTPSGSPTRTIRPDGTIEMRYPDGTVKSKRIGSCGWDIRYPDGRFVPSRCVFESVTPLVPPDPPPGSSQAKWLTNQDEEMLSILEGLLGGANTPDFQNYLKNYENPPDPEIYKRIYHRTQAIAELASVPQ